MAQAKEAKAVNRSDVYIEQMTWQQVEALTPQTQVVIVPLGAASKEHGPHLPLNTDKLMAEKLTARLSADLQQRGVKHLIGHTITDNYYPAFTEYPGSVSLERATALGLILDRARSYAKHGLKKIYFLNTGFSTLGVFKEAQSILQQEGIEVSYFSYPEFFNHDKQMREYRELENGSHGGASETAIMLELAPKVVDMSKAVDEDNPDLPGALTRDASSKDKTISVSGVWGKATLATPVMGKKIVDTLVQYTSNQVQKFIGIDNEPQDSSKIGQKRKREEKENSEDDSSAKSAKVDKESQNFSFWSKNQAHDAQVISSASVPGLYGN